MKNIESEIERIGISCCIMRLLDCENKILNEPSDLIPKLCLLPLMIYLTPQNCSAHWVQRLKSFYEFFQPCHRAVSLFVSHHFHLRGHLRILLLSLHSNIIFNILIYDAPTLNRGRVLCQVISRNLV